MMNVPIPTLSYSQCVRELLSSSIAMLLKSSLIISLTPLLIPIVSKTGYPATGKSFYIINLNVRIKKGSCCGYHFREVGTLTQDT